MRLSRTLFPPNAPDYERRFAAALADYDVFQRLDKLGNRPLLLWHGDVDPLVPPAESAWLYQALAARGAHHQGALYHRAGDCHKITVGALAATVAFFCDAL